MTIVFSDNFDSYTTGAIVGQGGWTGSGTTTGYTVENTTSQSPSNAVTAPNNINGNGFVSHTFTAITTGTPIVSYYARNDTASQFGATVFLGDGTNTQNFGLYMFNDNTFQVFDGTSFHATGVSWLPNTFYFVEIQVDVVNKQARTRINGGTFTSYFANSSALTQLASIQMIIIANNSGSSFWDTFSVDNGVTANNSGMFFKAVS